MPSHVNIPPTTFKNAVEDLIGSSAEKKTLMLRIPEDGSSVPVFLEDSDRKILKELLDFTLTKATRTKITQYLAQFRPILMSVNENVLEDIIDTFDSLLCIMEEIRGKRFEAKIMNRWYPFQMPKIAIYKWMKRIVGFEVQIRFQMVRESFTLNKFIAKEGFQEIHSGKTLGDILQKMDIRSPDIDSDSMAKLINLSIGLGEDFGKQILIRGPVLEVKVEKTDTYYGGDRSWETIRHIFEKEKAVVEPELEIKAQRRNYHDQSNQTECHGTVPFIRAFSLRTRTFLYTDFRNVENYEYQTNIENRLLLNPKHRKVVQSIFSAEEETIKDLIPGKTGGLCVLAWGNPGVGKTLTAEIYAETKERPLYSLSVSEVGTEPVQIESNLQRIFTRVERWNAVLLFDECDVFLCKRGDDIKQAAVTGMFLRLMDYYSGTLFLTTNRLGVIDDAIDSRLAFRIHYEDLKQESRLSIWELLLQEAKITVDSSIVEKLSRLTLDGRKIRNMVRAIQLMKLKTLSWKDVEELLPYIQLDKEHV